jgi:hypothetical protein
VVLALAVVVVNSGSHCGNSITSIGWSHVLSIGGRLVHLGRHFPHALDGVEAVFPLFYRPCALFLQRAVFQIDRKPINVFLLNDLLVVLLPSGYHPGRVVDQLLPLFLVVLR